ncbi:protein kinase domain-containing protein [Nocardiopsis flavescens]
MSLSLYVGPDSQPDKYRLVRSVGRGGEATLYLAEVTLAGQTEPVVVKALNADTTADPAQFAELSSRWAEQAELLRFINRLGVVGVREHFEGAPEHPRGSAGERAERCLYLVMNHIDGLDLRDWRAEHAGEGVRGQREVLRYLEQVAQVLDMLHAGRATPSRRPVVHGDLSPGNIMIDADGQATLVDFGLSRIAARHMTARPWFTPGYAAPEIFSGEYSPATDRYAFGAVAFYALTGEDPPPAPERLRERFAALPLLAGADERPLAVVVSMFSADPGERPEASEWVRSLRSLATSVPWTGPGGEPAADPGASAVFAASLFSAAAPEEPAPADPPRGPAVAGPPPADPAVAPAGAGDPEATVVRPPVSGAVPSAPGAVPPVSGAPSGSSDPAAPQDTDATVVLSPASTPGDSRTPGDAAAPQGPAVAGPPPAGAGDTDATVFLSPASAPVDPRSPHAPSGAAQNDTAAPDDGGDSDATFLLPPNAAAAPSDAGASQDTDATVVLSPASAPGDSRSPGDAAAPRGPAVAGPPPADPAVAPVGAGDADATVLRSPAPGAVPPVSGAPSGSSDPAAPQDTDATVVLSPRPANGTPATDAPRTPAGTADTPASPSAQASGPGGRTGSDTGAAPAEAPGVEEMPHRPVGGLRGRPVQQRPAAGPAQPNTASPAPSGRSPRRSGGPTPPGGTARPPLRSGSGPQRPVPAHSGPGYGPPPPYAQPAWGAPPPPGSTGAFPVHGHHPAPGPPPGKRSRKPLLIGLAALAVLCAVGGSAVTYLVMDRGLPFPADGAQQVAADDPGESPAASEAEEEAPPMAAAPSRKPDADASDPAGGAPSAEESLLLTQMDVVEGEGRWEPVAGRAEVNGEAYSRALVVGDRCTQYNDPCTGWADYNLGRGWTTFTATLGVTDTSSSSAVATFTVYVDGRPEVTESLRLGETIDIEVDVRDALRLRIGVESDAEGLYPVWADPTLTT